MLQQDTIAHRPAVHTALPDSSVPSGVLTPADVIASLPPGATPEQQDSAIQANFRPGEVHYCERPDTLPFFSDDTLGQKARTGEHPDGAGMTVPEFGEDMFVPLDSLLRLEPVRGSGVAGDPVPYTVRNDDMITGLLIACFILVAVALSNSRRFIIRQLKDIIYVRHSEDSAITETSSEVRFQGFLILHTCLQLAIFQYFYTLNYIGDTFILESQYQLIAIYFAMFAGYFIVKGLLYQAVNTVFFGSKKNLHWMKSMLFIISTEGVVFFPMVMLQVYFDLPVQNVVVYFIAVLIFVKMLTFYKCYFIFFRRAGGFLQIILYFCALEIVPMAAFWGALVITGNHLNVNF